jgi:hypothetical protein
VKVFIKSSIPTSSSQQQQHQSTSKKDRDRDRDKKKIMSWEIKYGKKKCDISFAVNPVSIPSILIARIWS